MIEFKHKILDILSDENVVLDLILDKYGNYGNINSHNIYIYIYIYIITFSTIKCFIIN